MIFQVIVLTIFVLIFDLRPWANFQKILPKGVNVCMNYEFDMLTLLAQ